MEAESIDPHSADAMAVLSSKFVGGGSDGFPNPRSRVLVDDRGYNLSVRWEDVVLWV